MAEDRLYTMRSITGGQKTVSAALVGLAGGLLLSAIVFFLTYEVELQGQRNAYAVSATMPAAQVRAHIEGRLEAMHTLAALLQDNHAWEAARFAHYARQIESRYPSIASLRLASRVPASGRDEYEKKWGLIKDWAGGDLIRAGERDEYFPITFSVPADGSDVDSLKGLDIAAEVSDLVSKVAYSVPRQILAARYVSLPVPQGHFTIAVPAYHAAVDNEPSGVLVADLDVPTLFARLYRQDGLQIAGEESDVYVFMSNPAGSHKLLYARGASARAADQPVPLISYLEAKEGVAAFEVFDVAGVSWTLVARPLDPSFNKFWSWRPWANALIVFALAICSILYFRSIHMRAKAAHALADRRLSELEAANVRFHSILSATPDPLLFIDVHGVIQDVNPPFQRVFGYAPNEVISQTVDMLMPLSLRQEFTINCFDFIKSPGMRRMGVPQDFVVLTKDGKELEVEITLNPVVIESGSMVAAIVRDISAQKKAEADLRRSEHLLKVAQRISHVGSWEIDFVNQTSYRSEELARILEQPSDIRFLSIEDLILNNTMYVHPEDRDGYVAALDIVRTTGRLSHYEYRLLFADDRIKYIRTEAEPVYNDRGELIRAVGTSQDVTAEKTTQEALRFNERRLAEAQKVAQLGSWERDRTDQVHWSEGLCAIYNMSSANVPRTPAEAMALTWKSVHPDDRLRVEELFRSIRDGATAQNPIEVEYRLALPDGQIKYVRSRVIREFDEKGEFYKAMGIVQDVTKRRLAKMRIENTENQLRTLTNNLPVFVAYIDTEETLLFINETGAKWYGRTSPSELTGKSLKAAGDHKSYEVTTPLRERGFRGETVYEEALMEFIDGTSRWLGMQFVPDLTPERSVRGLYIMLSDIDRRRRMEQRLVQSQKIEAIGQLTGGIAHDFNNILTVIRGNLQMVTLPPEMIEAAKRIDRAVSACGQASDLVSRLLTFARQQELRPGVVAVTELIRNIVKLLRGSLAENITIDAILPSERLWTHADPSQLESALVNLVINARDAMPRGGRITITAEIRNDVVGLSGMLSQDEYVCVSVSDTGMGMTDDVKTRALEPFFTTKDFGKGSGLGLSMVHGFVEQTGGTMRIDSERNKGTTIHLYLPASKTEGQERVGASVSVSQDGGAQTILVVEDREELREMVSSFLATLHYRVVEARDGAEALSMLEHGERFDLLFTDIIMPGGINGMELAQHAHEISPDMRVLYTTGYVRDGEAAALSESAHILRKPYALSELAAAVTRALAP